MYASSVGAILVIAQLSRAKTSFAPTKKRSYNIENFHTVPGLRLLEI